MKSIIHISLRLSCLLMLAAPLCAAAQTNIKGAFEKLTNSPGVECNETHSLERDIDSGKKSGQSDVYRFKMPANKKDLIKNVMDAFRKDGEMAYSISSGTKSHDDADVMLAVGDDAGKGVNINPTDGCNYIYACFLAPKDEDPEGKYRYAYAMNWSEANDTISGMLVSTYATTMKYRQDHAAAKSLSMIASFNEDMTDTWFKTFMKYVQSMSYGNVNSKRLIAGKIYEHTKVMPTNTAGSDRDKETAREILKTLLSEKGNNDTMLQELLRSSLINIK